MQDAHAQQTQDDAPSGELPTSDKALTNTHIFLQSNLEHARSQTDHLYYFLPKFKEKTLLLKTNEAFYNEFLFSYRTLIDGQYDEARGNLLSLLSSSEVTSDAYSCAELYLKLLIAYTFLLEGDFDKARNFFQDTLSECNVYLRNAKTNTAFPEANLIDLKHVSHISFVSGYMLHRLQQAMGKYSEALEGYQNLLSAISILEDSQGDSFFDESYLLETIYYRLAECLLMQNKPYEASTHLQYITQFKPSFFRPYAHYHQGALIYESNKDLVKALREYQQIPTAHPMYVDSLLAQAHLYQHVNTPRKARKLYQQVIADYENHPRAVESYAMLGQAAYEGEKFKEAIKWLSVFTGRYMGYKERPKLLFYLGDSHLKRKDPAGFQNAFNYLLSQYIHSPYTLELLDKRVQELVNRKKIPQAQSLIVSLISDKVIDQAFKNTLIQKYASLLSDGGRSITLASPLETAKQSLQAATTPLAKSQLAHEVGKILMQQNNLTEAERYFQESFSHDTNTDAAMASLLSIARIKMLQNNDTQAELAVLKILNFYPDKDVSPTAELELAKYYQDKAKAQKSIQILRRLVNAYPQSKAAEEAANILSPPPP